MQSSSLGFRPSCNVYIKTLKHYVSQAGSASVLREETLSLSGLLDQAILNHWVTMKHKCGQATENRNGPWVITGNCYRKIEAQPRESKISARNTPKI